MISVIIPTYRRYEMLKEAVNSVLAQTYQDVEIIVVDDCSGDDTAQIAAISPKINYLCNDCNRGPGYSRRRGLLLSQGEYVVFLDDDDYYTNFAFYTSAVKILNDMPTCIFVAGNAIVSYEYDGTQTEDRLNVVGSMDATDYLQGFPFAFKKPHSTFTSVFRRSALLAAGIAGMEMLNDMPLYMRSLTVGGTVFFMEDTIGCYRIHNTNISKTMTWDFIRANLEEKHIVKQQIECKKLFSSTRDWWLKQIEITVNYFIYGSHPTMLEWKKARKWCLEHSSNKQDVDALFKKYKDYLIDYRICNLKSTIKRKLGMK